MDLGPSATEEMKGMMTQIVVNEGDFLSKFVEEMQEFCKVNGVTPG